MSDREEVAKQVLKYIEAGLNNDSLMEKYGHAYDDLQSLFKELSEAGFMGQAARERAGRPKRRIKARDVLRDIRGGRGKSQLMENYSLTLRSLQKVLRQLVDTKLVRAAELPDELLSLLGADVSADTRREPRHCIDFDLPVWEAENPQIKGQVLDITERGIGILGLPAVIGEAKSLLIYSEEFIEIEPFMMKATCRWVKRSEENGEYVSGFQVAAINDGDLKELRKLIRLLLV